MYKLSIWNEKTDTTEVKEFETKAEALSYFGFIDSDDLIWIDQTDDAIVSTRWYLSSIVYSLYKWEGFENDAKLRYIIKTNEDEKFVFDTLNEAYLKACEIDGVEPKEGIDFFKEAHMDTKCPNASGRLSIPGLKSIICPSLVLSRDLIQDVHVAHMTQMYGPPVAEGRMHVDDPELFKEPNRNLKTEEDFYNALKRSTKLAVLTSDIMHKNAPNAKEDEFGNMRLITMYVKYISEEEPCALIEIRMTDKDKLEGYQQLRGDEYSYTKEYKGEFDDQLHEAAKDLALFRSTAEETMLIEVSEISLLGD